MTENEYSQINNIVYNLEWYVDPNNKPTLSQYLFIINGINTILKSILETTKVSNNDR